MEKSFEVGYELVQLLTHDLVKQTGCHCRPLRSAEGASEGRLSIRQTCGLNSGDRPRDGQGIKRIPMPAGRMDPKRGNAEAWCRIGQVLCQLGALGMCA